MGIVISSRFSRVGAYLTLASLLGLGVGWVQAGAFLYQRYWVGQVTWQTRDIPWMSPLSNGAVILAIAVVFLPLVIWPLRGRLQTVPVLVVTTASLYPLMELLADRVHPYALLLISLAAGYQLARVCESLYLRLRHVMSLLVAGMLSAAGAAYVAIRVAPAEAQGATAPVAGSPNVLILLLDTVRAASMSLYGYERLTTPHLQQFVERGVTFDRAVSPSSWTLPSHASIFTGVAPHALQADWRMPLGRRRETLAERFRAAGYRTGGFVANNWYTSIETGLARGFDRWTDFEITWRQWRSTALLLRLPIKDQLRAATSWREAILALRTPSLLRLQPTPPYPRKRADIVSSEFMDWQAEEPSAPFFAFLNFYDAHDPYRPPPPFDTRFSLEPTPQDHYDGALAYLDAHLAVLLDSLQSRDLLDNTIIVVTSDHGELFGENGKEGHGNGVFWRTIHVPLVVVAPGRLPAGVRVSHPVSQIDLGRFLIDLAGIDRGNVGGESLDRAWEPGSHASSLPILAEFWPSRASDSTGLPREFEIALVSDSLQLLRFADGHEELFNLTQDPTGSTESLPGEVNGEVVGALRARMDSVMAALARPTTSTLSRVKEGSPIR